MEEQILFEDDNEAFDVDSLEEDDEDLAEYQVNSTTENGAYKKIHAEFIDWYADW